MLKTRGLNHIDLGTRDMEATLVRDGLRARRS
jgi:hypothetical protein